MSTLVIDIETGPLPDDVLLSIYPWKQEDVKLGALKDPEKIQAKILDDANGHLDAIREKAALNPWTGRVLAIGVGENGGEPITFDVGDEYDEKKLLETWWAIAFDPHNKPNKIVGWGIKEFDIPYLIRRSWANKITVPQIFMPKDGRYWGPFIKDMRDTWSCGIWKPSGTLDEVSAMLGVGRKNGNGADFANLFATDRGAALDYLRNDVKMTQGVYNRLENHDY